MVPCSDRSLVIDEIAQTTRTSCNMFGGEEDGFFVHKSQDVNANEVMGKMQHFLSARQDSPINT